MLGLAMPALAQAQVAQPSESRPAVLNPTGRDIALTGPLRDGQFLLGEIGFTLTADNRVLVDAIQLEKLLTPVVDSARLETWRPQLAAAPRISAEDLAKLGLIVRYDASSIGLSVDIPADARSRREIRLQPTNGAELLGKIDPPAGFSGYINFRSSADYVWTGNDRGFSNPIVLLDSAFRYGGVVLEGEGTLRFGGIGRTFVREGTRFIYDDPERLARWTAGDLLPISRGFSGAPQIGGVSLVRSYSVLQPQRNVQPRGERTFTLNRPSTVEAFINGQPVRRIRLEPGIYNIRDFPFVQGANDVRLEIEDDAGGRNVIEFSLFFDRTLLERGLTEFGLYLGARSRFSGQSRAYDFDQPAASGFFRRGVTDTLTLGANFQVQRRGAVAGVEAVTATRIGTIGGDVAISQVSGIGTGYAVNIGYQNNFGRYSRNGRSILFSIEHRSRNFATPNDIIADNRFAWDLAGAFSQALGERAFLSLSGQYSVGRDAQRDQYSARANFGYRLTDRVNLNVEGIYENRGNFTRNYGVRAGVVWRLGPRSSAIAEIDTRYERARIGYQTSRGEGVGAWAASANLEQGRNTTGADLFASYSANRAELAAAHRTIFDITGRSLDEQRSSLRVGTAIAIADGHIALSRPIFDSFAMVRPHKSLKGAPVVIDPREGHYTAKSGIFGPAVEPNLSSYSDRVITFDAPSAPVGYDIGLGNFRVYPPYRSGYLQTVGSDYATMAMGVLLDQNGEPVSLLAGRVEEIAAPDRPPITIFTNRVGRFGIQGLRPGKWRIVMPTEPESQVIIDIPESKSGGIATLGDVKLGDAK